MNERRKIVFVITRADIGGAQNHLKQLLAAFHDEFQCVLIVGSSGPLVDAARVLGVVVYIVPALNRKTFLPALLRLCLILRSEHPDLLHVHSALAGFVGRVAAKILGIKTLYTVHGWHFVNNRSFFWKRLGIFLERRARTLTDHYLLLTLYDQSKGLDEKVIKPDETSIIANGLPQRYVNKTVLKNTLNSLPKVDTADVLNIVFIGRATPQKNGCEAIRVIEQCPKNTTLTLFSASGSQTGLMKRHLQSSVAANRIRFIEDWANAAEYLTEFDVLLLTSKHEGMPLVVLEAMRAGLPIVATNVCGLSEIVLNNNGFLYPLGNVAQAAQCLQQLANDANLRRQYGKNSRRIFEKHHTERVMLEKISAVYQKVLSK